MRDEIRKRIEAVRRGEIPDGYIVENHQRRPLDWKYEKIAKYLVAHDEYSNDTERYMLATSSRQGLLPQTDYYNDQRFEETTGGFHVVPEGYVTYRHMSDDDVFKFNVNDLGAPVLVSPEYPVFTTNAELNQSLLIEYLNGTNEFRSFCRAQKKGSTRTRMYFSRLGEFMMPIPPISEQQKIADILSACDRVIELKQKRVEELKQLKKTCLAKMFPREGEDVPELRFPGFTAPWEQRKLGELCSEFKSGDFISAEDIAEAGSYPVFGGNGLRGYTDRYNHDGEYALIGRQGALCGNMNFSSGKAYFTEHAVAVKADKYNDTRFLFYCFGVMNLGQFSGQSAQPGLAVGNLVELKTMVPTKPEQECISASLTALDTLITLHQRELEAGQQKKKALMQLLLTGLVRVKV